MRSLKDVLGRKISMTTMKEALEFVNRDECNEFEKVFMIKGRIKIGRLVKKQMAVIAKNAKKYL